MLQRIAGRRQFATAPPPPRPAAAAESTNTNVPPRTGGSGVPPPAPHTERMAGIPNPAVGGHGAPGAPNGGGSKAVPLLIGALLIGSASYYVLSDPAAKAQAKHDIEVVKGKAGSLVNKAEDKIDDLTADKRSLGDKAHDKYVEQKNLAGSKPDQALAPVAGWFGGNSSSKEDEAKRLYEKEKANVKQVGQDIKEEVRFEPV